MYLLSLISEVTKRREEYFSQAKALAKRSQNLDNLIILMSKEAKAIVTNLRNEGIRWEEYRRSVIDKALVTGLTAVYMGAGKAKPDEKMEKAWPKIVGSILPPLNLFLEQTKERLDRGVLVRGSSETSDFASSDLIEGDLDSDSGYDDILSEDILNDPAYDTENPEVLKAIEASIEEGQGRTWGGTLSRVIRYVASPAYSFFSLGLFLAHKENGFKEARRISKRDKRTCRDCKTFEDLGWLPIGELPIPGEKCRCFDRCRCFLEYR